MKIISKKEWEKINQTMVNLQLDYNDLKIDNNLLEEQVKYLQKELENEKTASDAFSKVIEEYYVKIENQRMLIRNLKTLLTKNKIDYKNILNKKVK